MESEWASVARRNSLHCQHHTADITPTYWPHSSHASTSKDEPKSSP